MVFLIETNIDKQRMEKVRSCGFLNRIDIEAEGSRRKVCLVLKGDTEVCLRSYSRSHIDVTVKEIQDSEKWRFIGFYGSPYSTQKNSSWNLLRKLGQDQNLPWVVNGDFNEIMYSHEKSRGLPREERRMEVFQEVLEEC